MAKYETYEARADVRRAEAIAATASPFTIEVRFAGGLTDNQQAATLAGGGGKADQAAEEKKVCKQLATTGSRLPKRACLTAKEWKQLDDELSH